MVSAAVSPVAQATPPVQINGPITDPTGFFDSTQTNRLKQAADQVRPHGVVPYMAIVPDFSGMDPLDWCVDAADGSGLPSNAIVYVIAYQERDSEWCRGPNDAAVSDEDVEQAFVAALDVLAETDPLLPATAAEAGIVFFHDLAASASGGAVGGVSSSSSNDSSGSGAFWVLILLLGGVGGFFVFRGKKRKGKQGKANKANVEEQVQATKQQLLYADEALREAEEDAQFARAQFGSAKTQALASAVTTARSGITQAFELLPGLDEGTNQQKAAVADQITQILQTVMPPVKEAQDQLQAVRDREIGAEQQLKDLQDRIAQTRSDIPTEQRRLADLGLRFTPVQLASLKEKPELAEKLLDSAQEHVEEARKQLPTNRSGAVESLDTAARQLALAMAALESVKSAEETIGQSDRVLAAAIASISSDLDDVSRLATNQAAFQPLVADAQAAVQEGQAARRGDGDPLQALAHLRSAEEALDTSLAPLRSEREQAQRNEALALERLAAAEALVNQAQLQAQAGGAAVPLSARGALTNATKQLQLAQRNLKTNPTASIAASSSAEQHAQTALAQTMNMPIYQQNRRGGGSNLLWGMALGSMMSGGGRSSYSSPYRGSYGTPAPRRNTSRGFSGGSSSGFRGGSSRGGSSGFRGGSSGGFRGGSSGGRGKF